MTASRGRSRGRKIRNKKRYVDFCSRQRGNKQTLRKKNAHNFVETASRRSTLDSAQPTRVGGKIKALLAKKASQPSGQHRKKQTHDERRRLRALPQPAIPSSPNRTGWVTRHATRGRPSFHLRHERGGTGASRDAYSESARGGASASGALRRCRPIGAASLVLRSDWTEAALRERVCRSRGESTIFFLFD